MLRSILQKADKDNSVFGGPTVTLIHSFIHSFNSVGGQGRDAKHVAGMSPWDPYLGGPLLPWRHGAKLSPEADPTTLHSIPAFTHSLLAPGRTTAAPACATWPSSSPSSS
jgi:hypothetical protein